MHEFFKNDKTKCPYVKVGSTIDENDEKKTRPMTLEEFKALSDEEAFHASFPVLNEATWKNCLSKNDFLLSDLIYCLRIKNLTGYMESCYFCGDKRCEGCPLPYTDDIKFEDLLRKIGQQSNDSFYLDGYNRGKKDIVLETVWHQTMDKSFFAPF
jgi:hypothetical protein